MEAFASALKTHITEHVRTNFPPSGNVRLSDQVRSAVNELQIPYFEVYDGERRLRNTFASPQWSAIKPAVMLPELPEAGKEERFSLVETPSGPFLVFASGPAETENAFGERVVRGFRGVAPVDGGAVERLRETYAHAFWLVLATGVVFALALFPMIFYYYRRLRERNKALIRSYFSTIAALGNAVAHRDAGTSSHNYRVTLYTLRIAEAMACCSKRKIASMILGAYLHDIGKIGIPDNILLKPGRLTPEEFSLMKSHVEKGMEIVSHLEWLEEAEKLIGGHHEKYDGSGYPNGLRGEAIPLEARIFSVADVFDALNSRRPYKEPMDLDASVGIIRSLSGTHFDPKVVEAFLRIVPDILAETMYCNERELETLLRQEVEPYISRL